MENLINCFRERNISGNCNQDGIDNLTNLEVLFCENNENIHDLNHLINLTILNISG